MSLSKEAPAPPPPATCPCGSGLWVSVWFCGLFSALFSFQSPFRPIISWDRWRRPDQGPAQRWTPAKAGGHAVGRRTPCWTVGAWNLNPDFLETSVVGCAQICLARAHPETRPREAQGLTEPLPCFWSNRKNQASGAPGDCGPAVGRGEMFPDGSSEKKTKKKWNHSTSKHKPP